MMNGYHIRLARADDLSALPEIERQADTLFAAYGLAEQLSDILTPIESLHEGVKADRLWVATDENERPVGFALAGVVGDNAHLDELDGPLCGVLELPAAGVVLPGASGSRAKCCWMDALLHWRVMPGAWPGCPSPQAHIRWFWKARSPIASHLACP